MGTLVTQKKGMLIVLLSTLPVLAGGCAYTPIFGFPRDEANIAAGRQAFIDHRCQQCHSVAGERLPVLAGASRPMLELGGETSIVRNYADLMTSVINPKHAISERYREQLLLNAELPLDSPMPTPELDKMSVRQLIDLVAFLDSKYQLIRAYDPGFEAPLSGVPTSPLPGAR